MSGCASRCPAAGPWSNDTPFQSAGRPPALLQAVPRLRSHARRVQPPRRRGWARVFAMSPSLVRSRKHLQSSRFASGGGQTVLFRRGHKGISRGTVQGGGGWRGGDGTQVSGQVRVSASSAAVTKHYEPHGLTRQALACSLFRLAVWGPEIDTQVSAGLRSPCRCCGGPSSPRPAAGDCGGPCRAAVSASVPHGRSPASVSLEGRSSLDVGPAWEIQGDLIPRSLPELHLRRADLFPSEARFPGPVDGPPRGPAALGRGPVFPGARLSPSLSPHPSVGAAGSEPAGPPTRGQHTALRALTPRGRR